jgi:hypothetical protein
MKNLNSKVTMIRSYALYSPRRKIECRKPPEELYLLGYNSVESG